MQREEQVDVLRVHGVASDDFLKIEQRGLEAIPVEERHGSPRELALVWSGAMANYISLLTGALVVGAPLTIGLAQGQLGLLDSILAIVLGSTLASIIHGFTNVTGARTGTPQMIFARRVFGRQGTYLSAFLTWLMAIGWFAVDCVIGGWALVQLAGLAGIPKTSEVALIAITLVLLASVIVAIYGHQTVHVFEKYGAIIFMAFCVLLFVVLFPKIHWSLPTTIHGLPRISAVVVGASFIYALVASWIPFASDYSRYLPANASTRSIAWWSGLGIGLPTAVLGIIGVLLFTINPSNPDLLSIITTSAPDWLKIPFLLFVVLGEIWANYFDVYTAGLVAQALDLPLKRWVSALVCGIIGAIGVYSIGIFSHFSQAQTYNDLVSNFLGVYVNFLLLTYLWVPAWAAVLLVDFFVLHHNERASRVQQGFFWHAFVAWLVGVISTIPFIGTASLPWMAQPWQGPIAHFLGGMDVSGIVGAVVSALLYYLLSLPNYSTRGNQKA